MRSRSKEDCMMDAFSRQQAELMAHCGVIRWGEVLFVSEQLTAWLSGYCE